MFKLIKSLRNEHGRTLAETVVTMAILGLFLGIVATLMGQMTQFNAHVSQKFEAETKVQELVLNISKETEFGHFTFDPRNPHEIHVANRNGIFTLAQTDEGIVRTGTTPDGTQTKRVLMAGGNLIVNTDHGVVQASVEYPYETRKGEGAAQADITLRASTVEIAQVSSIA